MPEIILRTSYLAGWTDCPRRNAAKAFRKIIADARYVLPETKRIVSSAVGTGVHAGAKHILSEKKESRTARISDAIEQSIEAFREETADGVDYDKITASRNDAEKQLKRMTETYNTVVAPRIIPIDIEHRIEGVAPQEITLTGQPDVFESASVRDLKTGRSGQKYHAQLGGYSLLAKANGITTPKIAVVDWLPRTSMTKSQVPPISFTYDVAVCEAEAKAVLKEVTREISEFIASGNPAVFPTNTNSILCSETYCSAFGTDFCPISKTIVK
jgi:hypothetical protein